MHSLVLVGAAFLASAVEMVEALTIVLAVGVTRGWRSAASGVVAALAALGIVVAALGPALARVPIDSLRLAVGVLLLVFGLQWLRKAILRASGLKALHDEQVTYEAELRDLEHGPARRMTDDRAARARRFVDVGRRDLHRENGSLREERRRTQTHDNGYRRSMTNHGTPPAHIR